MLKHLTIAAVALGVLSAGGIAFAQTGAASSSAQGEPTITFPIPELGNCTSKNACKLYCSNQAHIEACISFGESHGLMRSDEAAHARTFATMKGPGGCTGEACKAYCDDDNHVDECLAFAEAHGLVRAGDSKILKVIRESGGPGGCKNETECRAYCGDSAHRDACRKFAEDNGFATSTQESAGMDEYDQQNQSGHQGMNPDIEKLLATTGGPGGCTTEDACKSYCSDQTHMDECLQFGKDHGLMSQEEYDRAKKFAGQPGPGGCKGETCRAYCEDSAHSDECLKFAEEKGLITKDEAARADKLVNKPGPGGCRGAECQAYCSDQSHHDECVAFAVQNGFMTQAQADQMQQHTMQTMTGPGGCKTSEECTTFCKNNPEQCKEFRGAGDHPLPQQGINNPPCSTEEECAALRDQMRQQGGFPPNQDQNDSESSSTQGGQNRQFHLPANMTPEQQRQYDAYMQNRGGEASTTRMRRGQYQPGPDMQHQGQDPRQYQGQQGSSMQPPANMTPEQQHMYQQYQQSAALHGDQQPYQPPTPPAGGMPQGAPPSSGTTTPPPPPSSMAPSNLVAAVFSIFSRLLGF